MNDYTPKRKKIRGWKRRIRQVNRWGEWIKRPDLDWYNLRGYTYNRCTLYPFYMAEKRHPPLWFYKLIIAKLVSAFYEWDKIFRDLGQPYDLLIWLYDPAYICSEIICYKVDSNGEQIRFSWESKIKKPFPFEKLNSSSYNLKKFNWMLADEENIHFESDLEDIGVTAAELLKKGWEKKVQNKNEIYYAQRTGDLWMGRMIY